MLCKNCVFEISLPKLAPGHPRWRSRQTRGKQPNKKKWKSDAVTRESRRKQPRENRKRSGVRRWQKIELCWRKTIFRGTLSKKRKEMEDNRRKKKTSVSLPATPTVAVGQNTYNTAHYSSMDNAKKNTQKGRQLRNASLPQTAQKSRKTSLNGPVTFCKCRSYMDWYFLSR